MHVWRGALSRCLRTMGVDVDLSRAQGPLQAVADEPPATIGDTAAATVVADGQGRVLIRCAPAGAGGRTAVVGQTMAALIVGMANEEPGAEVDA